MLRKDISYHLSIVTNSTSEDWAKSCAALMNLGEDTKETFEHEQDPVCGSCGCGPCACPEQPMLATTQIYEDTPPYWMEAILEARKQTKSVEGMLNIWAVQAKEAVYLLDNWAQSNEEFEATMEAINNQHAEEKFEDVDAIFEAREQARIEEWELTHCDGCNGPIVLQPFFIYQCHICKHLHRKDQLDHAVAEAREKETKALAGLEAWQEWAKRNGQEQCPTCATSLRHGHLDAILAANNE